jgi:hypothetical protein
VRDIVLQKEDKIQTGQVQIVELYSKASGAHRQNIQECDWRGEEQSKENRMGCRYARDERMGMLRDLR